MPNAPARLTGRTMGIVGMGNIGRAIAAIAQHGLRHAGHRLIRGAMPDFPEGVERRFAR